MENSEDGLTFNYYHCKDDFCSHGNILFIIFHIFLVMVLVCIIRTIFESPGKLDKEYTDLYSVQEFVKYISTFILNGKDPLFDFSKMIKGHHDDEEKYNFSNILTKLEPLITSMNETSVSTSKYNSIDVTKRNLCTDEEEGKTEKVSHTFNEDILDTYETQLNKFLIANREYEMVKDLKFYENEEIVKRNKIYRRICGYCLVKKVN
jgi:hypothetical protein